MQITTRKILANSTANVMNGASNVVLVFLVPIFLVRLLSKEEYAAWALILQLATLTSFFRLGMDTAVGRYIAEAVTLDQKNREIQIIQASLVLLAGCTIIGLALTWIIAANISHWFSHMPEGLQQQARIAVLLVGSVMSAGLLTTSMGGYLTGIQRYDILATVNIAGRLLTGILIVCIAFVHGGLIALAVGWCVGLVITYLGLTFTALKRAAHLAVSTIYLKISEIKTLSTYCASLTVWAVAMLMVNGLDSTLVGYFQFGVVGYYTLAANLISLLAGLQGAVFAPLIPLTSSLNAKSETRGKIPGLLVTSTRYCLYLLLATGLPLLCFTRPCLTLWVGADYAVHTARILQILVLANIIRLIGTPYAALLIGNGEQRKVLLTPLVEGIVNLSTSVWLGARHGAEGVAWGTMIGAVAGFASNPIYNMRRTRAVSQNIRQYLVSGIGRPLLAWAPLCGLLSVLSVSAYSISVRLEILSCGLPATLWFLFTLGFKPEERFQVRTFAMVAWQRVWKDSEQRSM